jgi:hypothetical protein
VGWITGKALKVELLDVYALTRRLIRRGIITHGEAENHCERKIPRVSPSTLTSFHPVGPMAALQFSKMFEAFSEANEKEWKYDRNASLGASEAFACIRKAFFKKFGYEQDDEYEADWGAAKRGDIIENYFAVPAVQAILPENCHAALRRRGAGDASQGPPVGNAGRSRHRP